VPVWDELWVNFLAWLILVFLTALPVLALWFFQLKNSHLLPRQRNRLAPWSGFDVCLVFVFAQLVVPAFIFLLLKNTGFFNWLYGPNFGAGDADLGDARRNLWVLALAFPLQLAGTLIILRALSGTRLYQLGLSFHGAVRNVALGWLTWLLLTPPVIVLHVLAVWGYWVLEGAPPEPHSLTRLAEGHPPGVEWFLIILTGIVVAPVLEELLFRGVLQVWAAGRPWGGPIILIFAFVLTAGKCLNQWQNKIARPWDNAKLSSALRDFEPAVYVLVMVPICLLGERLSRRWLPQRYAARALFCTALLFASPHPWPTPVPLFVLGLGLGFLAYRTQSLVAPIVCHALFNGVACVVLVFNYAEPTNGRETTSAVRRPPSASTSRTVPASLLPRRTYASAIACPNWGDITHEAIWPTSLSARISRAPEETLPSPASFNPVSDRLTWP
jgi:membrane protease YdiL (CAAX protease family)